MMVSIGYFNVEQNDGIVGQKPYGIKTTKKTNQATILNAYILESNMY